MTDFLLVGGSFLMPAAWDDTVARLRSRGRAVEAVELSGLGDRDRHGGPPGPSLADHRADVLSAIGRAGAPVTLVAHSYAGVPAALAARDHVRAVSPPQVERIIFLGAVLPNAGESILDTFPPSNASFLRRLVRDHDGWRIPVMTRRQLHGWGDHGLSDEQMSRFHEVCTAHPARTYEDAVDADWSWDDLAGIELHYVWLDGDRGQPPAVTQQPWFRRTRMASGHWPMLSAPGLLARTLLHVST